MQALLLTVISPQRSIDLELPAEVPIAELLPALVKLCVGDTPSTPTDWELVAAERRTTLDAAQSLLEAHLVDGAIVVLQPQPLVRMLTDTAFRPRDITPGAESGGIGVRWSLPPQKQPFS